MKIEHIALYVNDLEGARNFFMNYFDAKANEGYHNTRTDFRSYFLTFEDGARLDIMTAAEFPNTQEKLNRFGYAHIAFNVGSENAVDTLTARLNTDGYPVISGPRRTGDGYYESCVLGFEGNVMEITV